MSKMYPSNSERRMLCPGSHTLESKYPREQSDASLEGIAAHEVLQQVLENGLATIGEKTSNGTVITPEMLSGAVLCRDHIESVCPDATFRGAEVKVSLGNLHSAFSSGYCDYYGYRLGVGGNSHLYIWDYKYGHRYVEVQKNWQLITYVAGLIDKLKISMAATIRVTLFIVQPRCFTHAPIRRWETSLPELQEYFVKLSQSCEDSLKPDAPRIPSPTACRYCAGRAACPELKTSLNPNPPDLPLEELSEELKSLMEAQKMLEARITGLQEVAISMLSSGSRVPGFRLDSGRGREIWKKTISEVIILGEIYGVKLQKPQDVVTPKQAVGLKIPREVIDQYSEFHPGELKLVEDNVNPFKGNNG